MLKNFSKMLEIIDQENKLYAELIKIGEEKKNVIINNDVVALEAITKKEQGFVKTIVSLEALRVQAVDGFCIEKGIKRVDTVTELMSHLSEMERLQFNVAREKMQRTIDGLKDVNELNNSLINQSLDYIELSLEIAKSFGMQDAGYGEDAADREVRISKGLFDAKI